MFSRHTRTAAALLASVPSFVSSPGQPVNDASLSLPEARLTVPGVASPEIDYAAKFPARYLPPLDSLRQPEFRDAFKKRFLEEFARPTSTDARQYVAMVSDAMADVGMTLPEQRDAWKALLAYTYLSFAERRVATEALISRYPDWDSVFTASKDAPLITGFAGGRLNFTLAGYTSIPANSPISLSVTSSGFIAADAQNLGYERRTVDVSAHLVSPDGTMHELVAINNLIFESNETGKYVEKIVPGKLPAAIGFVSDQKPSVVKIQFTARGLSSTGEPDTESLNGEVWYQLNPVKNNNNETSFGIEPLAPGGARLREPGLVEAAWMSYHLLREQKDAIRTKIEKDHDAAIAKENLIGQRLPEIKLSNVTPGGADHSLTIPQRGRVFIEFGATWCIPCKSIGRQLGEIEPEWKEQGISIVRLSVDRDRERFAAAVNEYPDGVVTIEEQDRLAINSVPLYILVQDGRIVSIGSFRTGKVRDVTWPEKRIGE